jgi:hypothetical protein
MLNYSIVFFDANGKVIMTCQLIGADTTHGTVDAGVAAQWPASAASARAVFATDPTADFAYAAKP